MIDPSAQIVRYAQSVRSVVNEAGSLLSQADDQAGNGTFDYAQCAKAARQLANLALTAGLEVVPLLTSIPCLPVSFDPLQLSDFAEVDPDKQCARVISVAKSFVQEGNPSCVIPDNLIVFVPGILRVYAKQFRVGTSWPNLQSGTYKGTVRLTPFGTGTGTGAPQSTEVDITVDL